MQAEDRLKRLKKLYTSDGGKMYIFRDKQVVETEDIEAYLRGFEPQNRRVRSTYAGNSWISTVFLSIDHSHSRNGVPILFETMVFRGKRNGYMDRYRTYKEAVQGHQRVVNKVIRNL